MPTLSTGSGQAGGTKTLTIVSTDEQFETAGEQLQAIAQLRERIKGTLKPFIEFWIRAIRLTPECWPRSTGRWKRGSDP